MLYAYFVTLKDYALWIFFFNQKGSRGNVGMCSSTWEALKSCNIINNNGVCIPSFLVIGFAPLTWIQGGTRGQAFFSKPQGVFTNNTEVLIFQEWLHSDETFTGWSFRDTWSKNWKWYFVYFMGKDLMYVSMNYFGEKYTISLGFNNSGLWIWSVNEKN